MILKVIGAVIFLWGLADLGMSFAGTDIWMDWLGIRLPDIIWKYSAYAAMVIGGIIWSIGGATDDDTEEPEQT